MFGFILLCIAWVATIIPIILTFISDTFTRFILEHVSLLMSYWLAAFTVGGLGVIILVSQFFIWLLNLIF